MDEKEYKKHLRQFHKESDRHVLTVEIHMGSAEVHRVVALSDRIRKAGNELVGLMRKNCHILSAKAKSLTLTVSETIS